MAHLITIGRVVLLFGAIGFLYSGNYWLTVASGLIIGITFLGDGLDGWVARRRGSTSKFGAVLDIAGDRVVENALWVVLADLQVIPIWVPLVVITRSFVVDAVRAAMLQEGQTPFGQSTMMRSSITQFLTASRWSRAYYGWSKAFAFVLLSWLVAWQLPGGNGAVLSAAYDITAFRGVVWFLTYSSVALCVIRGLPVLYDAVAYLREEQQQTVEQPTTDNTVVTRERPLSALAPERTKRGRPI